VGTAAGFAGGLVVLALVCFAVSLGISAGSLSPNGLLGIRTRATRSSDEAWYVGHRAAQPVLRLTGLACLASMAGLLVLGTTSAGDDVVVLAGLASYAVVVLLLVVAAVRADRAARGTLGSGGSAR
jgi:uncharacterized membrane protein